MGPESATRTWITSVAAGAVPVDGFCFVARRVFTLPIVPQSARTGCRPHHIALVMNPALPCLLWWGPSCALFSLQRSPGRTSSASEDSNQAPDLKHSSHFCWPQRARYRGGQYFPSLVAFGKQRYL